ncbi:MAG TPA: PIN domain-containing protein [Micromonosporaceae bacterium]|nr:PIN domain-containing protein [Micromonosporaceae bacterium]
MTLTVDTSVVIPALASWHESHSVARKACREVTGLTAHALLEAISVLTRLPSGLALAAAPAVSVVRRKFPDEPLSLTGAEFAALAERIAAAGLRGGQVYDALVAATAASRGARLLSLDTRAIPTYRAIGADYELLTG